MNKDQTKKATLQDFLAKKLKKEEEKNQIKTKDIYISSMDKTITCIKPSDEQIYDFMDDLGDKTSRSTAAAYKKILYKCCEELQNPQLHEEAEIKDPFDIMEIFDFEDMNEIIPQFDELIGLKKKSKNVEELKN